MKKTREIDIEKAREVLDRALPKSLIKQRDGGFGKKLDYIEGSTVIRLLNEAFGMKWDFEIVKKEIIGSVPRPKFTGYGRNKKAVLDANGNQVIEEQAPYVEVIGRLTIPGIGSKEQFGTKILLGGSSEQEGASKAAGTDALKKCATMLGVALELYEDDAPIEGPKYSKEKVVSKPYTQEKYQAPSSAAKVVRKKETTEEWNEKTTEAHKADLKTLKELKTLLGIEENSMLDIYTIEYFNNPKADFTMVLPSNIKKFNEFLVTKTPGV